jgi:UDP-N-acetylglucosamine 2-epimerase (non-hydrolysing)
VSKICTVVGARPNFMKMAPVILEARRRKLAQVFVHTGQHYDAKMSAIFFDALGMPEPDVYLGVGSSSHAEQSARIMVEFEQVCLKHKPSLVVVAGDVNSTLACALTATKLLIPVAHVEAGLRSFDRTMPEEINRVLTDHIASLLFTTEPSGKDNLLHEGIAQESIHFVGNFAPSCQCRYRRRSFRNLLCAEGSGARHTTPVPHASAHPDPQSRIRYRLGSYSLDRSSWLP